MTIALFPCGAAVVCGPCPACESYIDKIGDVSRVVIYQGPPGLTLVSGSVTYTNGGPPATVGMALVPPTHKLCFYTADSYNGPLVYASIPIGATITQISYTITDGGIPTTYTKDSVLTCTDGTSQILRDVDLSAPCVESYSVQLLANPCPTPCINGGATNQSNGLGYSDLDEYAYRSGPAYECSPYPPFNITNPQSGSVNIPLLGTCTTDILAEAWSMVLSGSVTLNWQLGIAVCGGSTTATYSITLTKTAGNLYAVATWTLTPTSSGVQLNNNFNSQYNIPGTGVVSGSPSQMKTKDCKTRTFTPKCSIRHIGATNGVYWTSPVYVITVRTEISLDQTLL